MIEHITMKDKTVEFQTSEEAVNYLEEYLQDKDVTLQYEPPKEEDIILRIMNRNDYFADQSAPHSTYIECVENYGVYKENGVYKNYAKDILELKSEVVVTSHGEEYNRVLLLNNKPCCQPNTTVYQYLCDYLKGKRYEVITDKNKVATLNAERDKAMATKTEETNKKELTFIDFSNQQMFNERTIKDKNGNDVTLVSVSLPASAEHKGYYIDVQKQYVYPSKYNNKMSCVSYVKGQDVPIKHYDKETKTQDKIVLKAEDVKKEFSSWRNNKKEKSNTETAQEQTSQPVPEYSEIADEEQDFEPIEI